MSEATQPATDKSLVTINKDDVVQANGAKVTPTSIRVHRTVKLDGLDAEAASTEDTMDVHAFATHPAMVGVNFPIKISRNFQSVGLEVLVQRPCYTEEIPQAIEEAFRLAKERVMREIPDIQRALNSVAGGNGGQDTPAQ